MSDNISTTNKYVQERAGIEGIGKTLINVGAKVLGQQLLGSNHSEALKLVGQIGKTLLPEGTKNARFNDVVDAITAVPQEDRYPIYDMEQKLTQEQAQVMIAQVESDRDIQIAEDANVMKRYISDMSGDSKITKLVRPVSCGALVLTFITSIIIFFLKIDTLSAEALKFGGGAIGVLGTIMATVLNFYIGSRKSEKIENIKNFYGAALQQSLQGDR